MNCLLVWNENRTVLLDTGVGSKNLGKLSYYGFHDMKNLFDLLHTQGFKPEQITDVVLSHLHFDHCGGCTYRDEAGNLQVSFPNARHWVGEKQWESYLQPFVLEKDAFRPEDLLPVFKAGLVKRIDSDGELFEGFRLKLFDGHTQGQIVSFIKIAGNESLLFPGDVIPTKAHLSDEWISAYDLEPMKSFSAKIKLKRAMKNESLKIVFYHDSLKSFN
jgi:glyoxylase-like metal-dependent hydrolase (beta-lactamase superfamily II)